VFADRASTDHTEQMVTLHSSDGRQQSGRRWQATTALSTDAAVLLREFDDMGDIFPLILPTFALETTTAVHRTNSASVGGAGAGAGEGEVEEKEVVVSNLSQTDVAAFQSEHCRALCSRVSVLQALTTAAAARGGVGGSAASEGDNVDRAVAATFQANKDLDMAAAAATACTCGTGLSRFVADHDRYICDVCDECVAPSPPP
jgi:hypothetical protein